jgi:hypothetical protein
MVREASNFFHVRKKWCGKVREGAGSIQFFSCKKKNTINHYHIFFVFFSCHIIIRHITYHAGVIDGDRHLFTQRFRLRVFGSSVFGLQLQPQLSSTTRR